MVNASQKYLADDIKRTQSSLEKDNQNMKQSLATPTQELYNEGGQHFASKMPDASSHKASILAADGRTPAKDARGDNRQNNQWAQRQNYDY